MQNNKRIIASCGCGVNTEYGVSMTICAKHADLEPMDSEDYWLLGFRAGMATAKTKGA